MKSIVKSPAKINLYLKIENEREDGYHNLLMVMQTISLFDTLEFTITKNKGNNNKKITLTTNLPYVPTDNKNLIYKIIEYIFDKYNINDEVRVNIKKLIPVGAGLGGGSSNGASTLLFLNKFYKLNLSIAEMINIAASFGSDIPFFIEGKEQIAKGRGEILTKINPYKNYYVLIATVNEHISTKAIFDEYNVQEESGKIVNTKNNKFNDLIKGIENKKLNLVAENISNDLEQVTSKMIPKINEIKNIMKANGAKNAMMSGSGPTVFGIFNNYYSVFRCKSILKNKIDNTFVFIAHPI